MDADRFDRLTRHVAGQASRRNIIKAVGGVTVAFLGVAGLRREAAADGFDGDTCITNTDCGDGLTCENASRGALGGLIAEGPWGPPIAGALPFFAGSSGRCRYRNSCGGSGDTCRNAGDCCGGFNCPNNRCRAK